MADYIPLKKSQIPLFKNVSFFYKTQNSEYALYKKRGEHLDVSRLNSPSFPNLYILDSDKENAMAELTVALNKDFAEKVSEGRLRDVRGALASIVTEALTSGQEKNMNSLPDTIDILMGRYNKDHSAMALLSQIGSNSSLLVEHTVNVTALALQYSFFHNLSDSDTQQLALAALLHDVGCSKLERRLVETPKRLSDEKFEIYKTHPVVGNEMITSNTKFDIAVPTVALEHHERIDGSGYPRGLKMISTYAQLIGLIDCYESLTYRSKLFRKKMKPYDTLNIIKDELSKKKFSKDIFKRFTSCLIR